jgi:hypothetical protein
MNIFEPTNIFEIQEQNYFQANEHFPNHREYTYILSS